MMYMEPSCMEQEIISDCVRDGFVCIEMNYKYGR